MRTVLLGGEFAFYFFDDNSSELLGYVATAICSKQTHELSTSSSLLPFDLPAAKSIMD